MSVVVRKHQNGWWQYDITGEYPDGEPYRERRKSPLASESASGRFAEARERELQEAWKEKRQAGHRAPAWKDAWAQWIEHSRVKKRNEESTLEWKALINRCYIEPVVGANTPIDKIGDKTIELVIAKLGAGAKPKSVNHVLGQLSGCLRLAQKRKQLVWLPDLTPQPVPENEPKHFEVGDFERFLAAAEQFEREGKWQPLAVALLGGHCGLRRSEMVALQRADLDFEGRRIFLRHSWWNGKLKTTKSNRFRVVAMSDRVHAFLRKHRHLRSTHVVVTARGTPPTPKAVTFWFELAAKRAGLTPEGKAHVLRHTLGSHMAEAGVDLHKIQEVLGHSDQRTTQIYARIAATRAAEAVAAVEAYRKHAGNKSRGKSK